MLDESRLPATVLAVDPGRSKCGIAVVSGPPHRTLAQCVAPTESVMVRVSELLRAYPQIATLVIGDGTQSHVLRKALSAQFPKLAMAVVDERSTTLAARAQYLERTPARGWRRLLPRSLRVPERPIDDVVAEILARKFLDNS